MAAPAQHLQQLSQILRRQQPSQQHHQRQQQPHLVATPAVATPFAKPLSHGLVDQKCDATAAAALGAVRSASCLSLPPRDPSQSSAATLVAMDSDRSLVLLERAAS